MRLELNIYCRVETTDAFGNLILIVIYIIQVQDETLHTLTSVIKISIT